MIMKSSLVAFTLCLVSVSCSSLPSQQSELSATTRRAGPFEPLVIEKKPAGTPWFCHDLECPNFKVLNRTDVYEVREYEAGVWASTKVSSLLYSSAVSTGFKRLFDYIGGENANHTKIPMTTPVVTSITPAKEHLEKSNYTVNLFLPYEFHKVTPKPTAEDVEIIHAEARKVFVLSFGGFLVDDLTLAGHAEKLKIAVLEDRHDPIEVPYFAASYDPPTRLTGRHNEVMMLVKKA